MCRAVRDLLPHSNPLSSDDSAIYHEAGVPEICRAQLASLVLTCDGDRDARNGVTSQGVNEYSAGEIRYHRSALLKFLRQMPS